MAASGPPAKTLPMPTGSIEDMAQRMKDLTKEAKDADKAMARAGKKGQEVSKEMIDRAKNALGLVTQQETYLKTRERETRQRMERLKQERESRGGIGEAVGGYAEKFNEARHMFHGAHQIAESLNENNVVSGIGDVASGLSHFLPGPAGIAAKVAGHILKQVGSLIDAKDARTKGSKETREFVAKSGIGGDSGMAGRLRKQIADKEYGATFGFGGNSGSGRLQLNSSIALSPEIEAKIDAKVKETVDKALALKKSGEQKLELGDFAGAKADFKTANNLVKGSVPMWYDPAAMWQESQSRAKASASQARERMGIRTVPGRDD